MILSDPMASLVSIVVKIDVDACTSDRPPQLVPTALRLSATPKILYQRGFEGY